jgi:hypothetical protein
MMGLISHNRGQNHCALHGLSSLLPELLKKSCLILPLSTTTSHASLPPRYWQVVLPVSTTCICSLFLAQSQTTDTFTRWHLVMALQWSGKTCNRFLFQCWPAMQEESLSYQILLLDLRLSRTIHFPCI